MSNPLVSVIVPTFNSERFLEKCLRSIKAQTYTNIEIIVVDNYSKDRTREIAAKYAKLVLLKGPERSSQVNFGVKHANGQYVYRVDSDFIVAAGVIKEAVNMCESEGFDALCVHNASDASVSFWAKVRQMERDCYKGDSLNVAARFIRRNVFEQLGGFDEKLVAAEDYDLHNRLLRQGFSIGFVSSTELHLGEPHSISEIIRKHYYYGKTVSNFINSNPERGFKQLNPIRRSFLRNYKIFLKNPKLTVGFFIYQIMRYGAGFLGYLAARELKN